MDNSNNKNQQIPPLFDKECQKTLNRRISITTKLIYITTLIVFFNALYSIVYLID